METRIITSIDRVPAAQWNALESGGNPFLRHEFLAALERAGCVGHGTGWSPCHLLLEKDGRLAGALPLYRKTHSWGEFVFDWSWARAYAQAGLHYYPKLVCMIPFTPASGVRLLAAPGPHAPQVRRRLVAGLRDFVRDHGLPSAHALFIANEERELFGGAQFMLRKDCQFHWHNRDYASFDEFIARFRADKRKKVLRERRRIAEAGVRFRTLSGGEMDETLWKLVFGFSAATFQAHGHDHYLNAEFFRDVSAALPEAVMIKLATLHDRPIASAIFFQGGGTLYGRYWGAAAEFHSLHFETCYYQGIEYCIERGLRRFEPGTQGEHKVPRGFEPEVTWSAHWIGDRRFARAIDEYLAQERRAIDEYIDTVREHVPYRRDLNVAPVTTR